LEGSGGNSFLMDRRTWNSQVTKKEQSLKAEQLNCLKRQDALQAFIRKIPVILYEVSAPRFNLTEDSY